MPTTAQRRWQSRLGSSTWDSHTWRWALRHEPDRRLRRVLKRGLEMAIRAEHGQRVLKWHWASLLSKASGVRVYPFALRPENIARKTPWMNPWKRRDGVFVIAWLARDGGLVVAHPDMPVVARFEPFSHEALFAPTSTTSP
jgi:hypothetical protein